MSDEIVENQILILKGLVSELPEVDRKVIDEVRRDIRSIVDKAGDNGFMALSIVAPEIALEKEAAGS